MTVYLFDDLYLKCSVVQISDEHGDKIQPAFPKRVNKIIFDIF